MNLTFVKNNLQKSGQILRRLFKPLKKVRSESCTIQYAAFSLVEMLMALLVASLLMAALAPVMTRKIGENVNLTGNMAPAGSVKRTVEIEYGTEDCKDIKIDSDGSTYCEGEFEVPGGYNGYMNVTVIGAGGGGGSTPTAGYTEYTTTGDHTFLVPAMVGDIETTLVSGGAGGGAGGQITKTQTFVTYGNGNMTADANNIVTVNSTGKGTWKIPEAIKNKQILATACGGGGGGGASSGNIAVGDSGRTNPDAYGYGGGTGGYILNQLTNFEDAEKLTYYIGGGGGGASAGRYNGSDLGYNDGLPYGGATIPYSANGIAMSGALTTSSTKGGKGGIGIVGTCKSPSDWTVQAYVNGGDGGSPDGGRGAQIHANPCYGGSGGGGGAASQLVIGSGIYLNAPGGGGGGGSELIGSWNTCGKAAGGGGGGGAGGGNGGSYNSHEGKGGSGGNNGNGINGGTINTIFGNNHCNGGNGGEYSSIINTPGKQGKSGAIKLTYIDYGPGGSGGGGGGIVAIQPVKAIANETLTIHIGKGGEGGVAGYLDTANKKIVPPDSTGSDHYGQESYLARNGSRLLRTNDGEAYVAKYGCATGVVKNSDNCANKGWISNGIISSMQMLTIPGFSNSWGKTAGSSLETYEENKLKWGDITFAPKTEGGDGGMVSLFNGEIVCEGGKGGTQSSPNGKNAAGYGCGGGGGWTFANGGKGSGGYARISWNKYWDTVTNAYKTAESGGAGGGASGNIFTYSIPVKSNQAIKFRIGKGGEGAYISNNTLTNATNGGNTVFGDIKAGGGEAGKSVSIDTSHNNKIINGAGGGVSNICHFGTTSYLNNKKCIKGIAGTGADKLNGGKGGNFSGYKFTAHTKEGDTEKTVTGTGGGGGVLDTGDNANGKDAAGYASGGGGAALRDLGRVNSESAGNITNNQNRGGNGGNGKIIVEWWE